MSTVAKPISKLKLEMIDTKTISCIRLNFIHEHIQAINSFFLLQRNQRMPRIDQIIQISRKCQKIFLGSTKSLIFYPERVSLLVKSFSFLLLT